MKLAAMLFLYALMTAASLGPQSCGVRQWGAATVIVTSGAGTYGPPSGGGGTVSEIVVIDAD